MTIDRDALRNNVKLLYVSLVPTPEKPNYGDIVLCALTRIPEGVSKLVSERADPDTLCRDENMDAFVRQVSNNTFKMNAFELNYYTDKSVDGAHRFMPVAINLSQIPNQNRLHRNDFLRLWEELENTAEDFPEVDQEVFKLKSTAEKEVLYFGKDCTMADLHVALDSSHQEERARREMQETATKSCRLFAAECTTRAEEKIWPAAINLLNNP